MDNKPPESVLLKPLAIRIVAAIAVIWLIKAVELVFTLDFSHYGIYPQRFDHLIGIIVAPLIHGSFDHLLSNTLPLFILTTALFYEYPKAAKKTMIVIYLGSGLAVWCFARDAHHIGASGITHGLMFFLFLIGILRRDKPAMAISMLVFFLYGSMVWGVLPTKEEISFESHLFGAVMGIVCAIVFRHNDPKPLEKVYSWEVEDEPEETDDEQQFK